MNRHLLSSSALHDFSDNSFARRASLAGGLTLGHGKKRPKIDIHFNDQLSGYHVPSYTTRERIHGIVTINAPSDIAFDDIHISFQGTSRTWVEKIATTAPTNPRTRAFHTFLRLLQPISESDLPENHVLRGGRSYQIPFEFVVPERLLPQSCSHSRSGPHVEEEHLKLPPSLGDAMVSGDGRSLHNDFAPEMTTISYSIRVVVTRKPEGSQTRSSVLGDCQAKLRIIPQVDEVPPLEISNEPGEDYILRRSKNVKKGILMGKSKVGLLTVEAQQPPPLRLPGVRTAGTEDVGSVMTMMTVRIRFDPSKAAARPPKLQMLWSRLKIATFFSTVPQKCLPSKSAAFSMDQNKGLMVETLPLSSRNLGGQGWKQHDRERRDSAVAFPMDQPSPSSRSPSPSASPLPSPGLEDIPSDVFYTADVLVPVELPYNKFAFVPTFHSCLISRVYVLDMNLSVSSGAGNSHSVHLKVPVQVTAAGSKDAVSADGLSPEGGYLGARQEIRDVFAPNMQYHEAPPSFDDIPPLGGRRATCDLGVIGSGELASQAADNVDDRTFMDSHSSGEEQFLAANFGHVRFGDNRDASTVPAAAAAASISRATSPFTRSPSPRTGGLTNDQILNTEDYETPSTTEEQLGSFSWATTSPRNSVFRDSDDHRRMNESLPPGYSSVAAGTMLMGTGGMVRALS